MSIDLAPTSLPDCYVGAPYSQTVTASGGTPPYTYSKTGFLPPGLSLASDGTISGTPTTAGIFESNIIATDSLAATGGGVYDITAHTAPVIDQVTLPDGIVGIPYSTVLTATGGTGPYTFTKTAGFFPPGIALASDGTISGTPSDDGIFESTISVTDSFGATSGAVFDLTITIENPTIVESSLPDGVVGTPYSQVITATGGVAPYTYAVTTGTLPAGLSLASSGLLDGTPNTAGPSSFTVTVTDHIGTTATQAYSPTIAKGDQTITFDPLADKTFGDPDFGVSATASSGLAVTFTATGNCSIATATVHITGAGSGTITAHQPGNSNWNAAPNVARAFAIAAANQTITFAALADRVYGEPPFNLSASASSGLPVTFTSLTPSVCTVLGNVVTIIAAGVATVRASQAGDANWNPAVAVERSFTVAKKDQTIYFEAPAAHTLGEPPFSIIASASSGLPVTFTADTANITVSGSIVTMLAAGTATITASQAGNANWNAATQVSRSFLIKAKSGQGGGGGSGGGHGGGHGHGQGKPPKKPGKNRVSAEDYHPGADFSLTPSAAVDFARAAALPPPPPPAPDFHVEQPIDLSRAHAALAAASAAIDARQRLQSEAKAAQQEQLTRQLQGAAARRVQLAKIAAVVNAALSQTSTL